MEQLRLAAAFPIGRLLDALEHLPEVFVTPRRPSPVHQIAIADDTDARPLADLCRRARDEGADVLIVRGAPLPPTSSGALPLPVISVVPDTTVEALENRVRQLESEALSPRLLAEERARVRIVDIVDRAAAQLDGHIIVEDQDFKMIAYSQLSSAVDEARRSAILQRQMPPDLQRVFNSQGVQASLLSGEDVVRAAADSDAGLGQRLIVAIRHRRRLVGTIWFARTTHDFDDGDVAVLQVAAEQMSVLLAETLRQREDEQIRRDDAATDLLKGRQIESALGVLRETLPGPYEGAHVLTLAQLEPGRSGSPADLSDFRALADSTVRTMRSEALTVPLDDRLHIIHFGCSEPRESCTSENSRRISEQMAENLNRVNIRVAVGIGRHAFSPQEIVDSARSAEGVLMSLLRCGRAEISTVRESWAPLVLDSLLNVSRSFEETVPPEVFALLNPSAPKHRELTRTVREALDHWGDVAGVAARLHVHQNTVRYRLQRFSSLSGVDLGDPPTRLALWALFTHLDLRRREQPGRTVSASSG